MLPLFTVLCFMADSRYTVSNISRIYHPLLPSFTRNLMLVLCSLNFYRAKKMHLQVLEQKNTYALGSELTCNDDS
jgi:hypothetical protein